MRQAAALFIFLVAFVLIGAFYAFYTPDWQAPDEPAHYNYIRQLANGVWPVIEPDDYDQEYQSEVISSGFASGYSVDSFEYEDYQPPLYYLLQTPVFLLTNGNLRALRLFSVLLGAGVVFLTFLTARRIFPQQPWLALTATAFVAFLPQHVAILASVNNDSLSELWIAAILLVLLGFVAEERDGQYSKLGRWQAEKWSLIGLGLLLGLGFLTKVTAYIMAPVIGLVILWKYWGSWWQIFKAIAIVFGIAIGLGLVWWIRNLVIYGFPDLLGTATHNRVVVGQPKTAEWIEERGYWATVMAFGRTTFQSFWGQFGWMGVVMPVWVYRLLMLFSALTGLGFLLAAWIARTKNKKPRPTFGIAIGVLLATFSLSLAIYLVYNFTFVQHQGRYLFSALVPISIGVAGAWAAIVKPATNRWPNFGYLVAFGLAFTLLGLDILALFGFIVPALT